MPRRPPSKYYWVSLPRMHRKYPADHLIGLPGSEIQKLHPSIAYIKERKSGEHHWFSNAFVRTKWKLYERLQSW